jgi:hypothetical protein
LEGAAGKQAARHKEKTRKADEFMFVIGHRYAFIEYVNEDDAAKAHKNLCVVPLNLERHPHHV